MSKEVRIILADAQYITSYGLRYLLSQTQNLKVVGVVSEQADLLSSIEEHKPDLVILDYNQPDSFGLEDIPEIVNNFPSTNVLIISSDNTKSNIRQTIKMGIKGFLTKKCREEELHNAIQTIMTGGRFFCDSVLNVIMEQPKTQDKKAVIFASLTQREKEIVHLVAEGLTTKQIAEKLFLSPHTVSTHRKNALKKLQINSVPELVNFVVREQLRDID